MRSFITTIVFGSFSYQSPVLPPYFCPPANPPGHAITNLSGVVATGQRTITVGVIRTNSLTPSVRAFVDWNDSKQFNEIPGSPMNEYINLNIVSSGQVDFYMATFTVPSAARPGALAFRVGIAFPGFPAPCSGDSFVDGTMMVAGAGGGGIEYQVNQPEAGLVLGSQLGTPYIPAVIAAPGGALTNLHFCASIPGSFFELVVVSSPLVALSGGGLTSAGGQIVNLSTGGGAIYYLNGGTLTVPLSSMSLQVSILPGLTLSGQMMVLSPTHPDGYVLSQPIQINT